MRVAEIPNLSAPGHARLVEVPREESGWPPLLGPENTGAPRGQLGPAPSNPDRPAPGGAGHARTVTPPSPHPGSPRYPGLRELRTAPASWDQQGPAGTRDPRAGLHRPRPLRHPLPTHSRSHTTPVRQSVHRAPRTPETAPRHHTSPQTQLGWCTPHWTHAIPGAHQPSRSRTTPPRRENTGTPAPRHTRTLTRTQEAPITARPGALPHSPRSSSRPCPTCSGAGRGSPAFRAQVRRRPQHPGGRGPLAGTRAPRPGKVG